MKSQVGSEDRRHRLPSFRLLLAFPSVPSAFFVHASLRSDATRVRGWNFHPFVRRHTRRRVSFFPSLIPHPLVSLLLSRPAPLNGAAKSSRVSLSLILEEHGREGKGGRGEGGRAAATVPLIHLKIYRTANYGHVRADADNRNCRDT